MKNISNPSRKTEKKTNFHFLIKNLLKPMYKRSEKKTKRSIKVRTNFLSMGF